MPMTFEVLLHRLAANPWNFGPMEISAHSAADAIVRARRFLEPDKLDTMTHAHVTLRRTGEEYHCAF